MCQSDKCRKCDKYTRKLAKVIGTPAFYGKLQEFSNHRDKRGH